MKGKVWNSWYRFDYAYLKEEREGQREPGGFQSQSDRDRAIKTLSLNLNWPCKVAGWNPPCVEILNEFFRQAENTTHACTQGCLYSELSLKSSKQGCNAQSCYRGLVPSFLQWTCPQQKPSNCVEVSNNDSLSRWTIVCIISLLTCYVHVAWAA